jgi:hypothetical protein
MTRIIVARLPSDTIICVEDSETGGFRCCQCVASCSSAARHRVCR